jgi:hypothetical protein
VQGQAEELCLKLDVQASEDLVREIRCLLDDKFGRRDGPAMMLPEWPLFCSNGAID